MELSTSEEEARLVRGEKEMRVAVDGVNALLAKIGLGDKDDTSVEDLGVGMDSVRRKRKKKISKHKYKKRRKVSSPSFPSTILSAPLELHGSHGIC